MNKTLMIEYNGDLAWSKVEHGISDILGENETGRGFSFLTGLRDISGHFTSEKTLQNNIERIKKFAKENRVRVYMVVLDDSSI
jgi:hypothetical protein